MMRRMFIVGAVVAIVASSAMATSLLRIDPLGTATTSQITAITNDGAYAVGFNGGGTTDRAFLWNASNPTTVSGPMVAGSFMSEAHGITYRTNPTTLAKELVMGGKQSSGQCGMFVSTNGGTTWTRPYATPGTGPGTAFSNAVGGNAPGTADFAYMGWTDSGANTNNYLTSISGDPMVTATAIKGNTSGQTAYVNGMSNTGRMVGARKDAGGIKQNVYQVGGSQTMFNGLDGTTHGLATAVSGDGNVIFGQSYITGESTTNYPYKYVVGGTAVALPLLPGTTGSVSMAYVYGASPDGNYAVGADYINADHAVLWGNLLDPNPVNWTVTDLSVLAENAGIAGGFASGTHNGLRRAYTIGIDAQGSPVIGGMGVITTGTLTRGFIMTVPEPATLAFLALGGLAMLRRRR